MSSEQLDYFGDRVCLKCWEVVKKPNQAVLMIPQDECFRVALGSQLCQKLLMICTTNRGLLEEHTKEQLMLKKHRPEVVLVRLALC